MLTPLQRKVSLWAANKNNDHPVFKANNTLEKLSDDIKKEIHNALPHGSGIDCDWTIEHKGNMLFTCSNSYHAMDQSGTYCGYVAFEVSLNAITLDFDVRVSQSDIDGIMSDYDEYITGDDVETNAPYLDDLEDYLYQTVDHLLEYYIAEESLKEIIQSYPHLIERYQACLK